MSLGSREVRAKGQSVCGREKRQCFCNVSFLVCPAENADRPSLQERKELEWGSRVELIFGDMRHIDVPEAADIMVSELLGSFGDNELSPECLDGAMRVLKCKSLAVNICLI